MLMPAHAVIEDIVMTALPTVLRAECGRVLWPNSGFSNTQLILHLYQYNRYFCICFGILIFDSVSLHVVYRCSGYVAYSDVLHVFEPLWFWFFLGITSYSVYHYCPLLLMNFHWWCQWTVPSSTWIIAVFLPCFILRHCEPCVAATPQGGAA